MANGYSIGMTGGVMPNPMGVVGNTRSVTSTMGMTGGVMPAPLAPFLENLPQSNSPVIVVSESTPNLMEIQNFPVVSRNGIFHIHQDPRTGQRYSMTDEFHMRIPQILASNQTQQIYNIVNENNISQFTDPSFSTTSNTVMDQLFRYINEIERIRTINENRSEQSTIQQEYDQFYVGYDQIIRDYSSRLYGDVNGTNGVTGGVMPRQVSLTENINYGNGTKVSTIINAPILPTNTYARSSTMINTSVSVVSTPSRIQNVPINTYYSTR